MNFDNYHWALASVDINNKEVVIYDSREGETPVAITSFKILT